VRKVCRRALSVGADGVILIEHDSQGVCDFAWRFFNADGSEAEMCGNGGRCAARFAHARGIAKKEMTFRTLAGVIRAEITGERIVKLQLTPPHGYEPKVELNIDGRPLCVKFLDTGVPHAILEVEDVEQVDPAVLGPEIRYHKEFAPKGANANFVHVSGPDSLFIRTYERGVEGETLACGTGCVAAAITMALAGRVKPPVTLTTRSREKLTVHFKPGDAVPEEVYFEGAVKWVYDGTLLPESLL
jgi:diaminopimelate epimerase